MKSDLVDLTLSKIEMVKTGKTMKGEDGRGQTINLEMVEVTLPEWLAVEKGLV